MIADLVVVSMAWLLAFWFRFHSGWVPVEKGIPLFIQYFQMIPLIWLIWGFVFNRIGLYKPMRGVRSTRELWLLINANALAVLLLIAATYLFREKDLPFSRLVFGYFLGLAIFMTVLQRLSLRFMLREVRRKGYNLRYMLIVGAGQLAGDLVARVRLRRELGIQLLGCLSKDGLDKKGPRGIPIMGSYADLKKIISNAEVDQVLVALPLEDNQLLPEVMAQVADTLVDVKIVPDLYQFVSVGGAIEEFEGLPIISVQSCPLDSVSLVAKRALDLCIAAILSVIFAPVLIFLALLVKLTSRGPIFYAQERVSFDGSSFRIFKFRTMKIDAEAQGPGWTIEADDRVTPLGKFLRKFSLDELPQLFNVIRGDMSIVGPRPERPIFIEEFRRRVPRYMLRHKVPAGMTGWAQVNGWRGNTSIDKRIEFDLYYIENWSILLDLKILFLTLFRGFRDRNAY